MVCKIEISDSSEVPLKTGCPADDEQLLFFNVADTKNGVALRTWATVKACLLNTFFGGFGIKIITGEDLDVDNKYFSSDFSQKLVVFYNGVNRFLLRGTEWDYILNGSGEVIGIQILITATFTSDDVFFIFPNPNGNT
jgi:hypothetical protein